MRYLLIIIFGLMPLLATAAIYKSIDKDGNVKFSDQPTDSSKRVQLPEVQTYGQSQQPASAAQQPQEVKKTKTVNSTPYTMLTITRPANNNTFWLGGSPISVDVNIQPALQEGDQAELVLDGQSMLPITGPSNNVSFTLTDYTAGRHTISVKITKADAPNTVVKTSNSVMFNVLAHRNNQKRVQQMNLAK